MVYRFCLYFLLIFSPIFVSAEVISIGFSTPSRTTGISEISSVITIELKGSSGATESLGETGSLALTSTSPTGRFVNAEGNDLTTTINSNWKTRSLYYVDSSEGTFTITAVVTGKTSGRAFTTSQSVTVGSGGGDDDDDGTDDDDTNDVDDNEDDSDSSHSSTKKLTTYTKAKNAKVSAGRNRTALVNTPINFELETSLETGGNKLRKGVTWSFGDGDSDSGRIVRHSYMFPGEYNVVVNVINNGEKYVSRSKVKILDASIEIASVINGAHGYVEIQNNNSTEVNIKGWNINSGDRDYVIADDTIINPKSSIKIPNMVMHFDPIESTSLAFPNEEILMTYNPKNLESQQIPVYANEPSYIPESSMKIIKTKEPKKIEIEVENNNQTASISESNIVKNIWNALTSLFFVH